MKGYIYNSQTSSLHMCSFPCSKAIYFANKAIYAHKYSYQPPPSLESCEQDRPGGQSDEREILLAKLLAGDEKFMDRDLNSEKQQECRQLVAPPVKNPNTKQRYNSVTGIAGSTRSKVWAVYGMFVVHISFTVLLRS